ncbi:MAG: HD domain-containing protein [Treponema sp.]|nr:HD domain-containing protein [Treponema sp.]
MNREIPRDIISLWYALTARGNSLRLSGFSAIDHYLGLAVLPSFTVETGADIAILAAHAENLRFPGPDLADGAADSEGGTCYFRCIDEGEEEAYSFPLLSFSFDWKTKRFQDPLDQYPLLRELRKKDQETPSWERGLLQPSIPASVGRYRYIMDGALLLARYDFGPWEKISRTLIQTLDSLHPELPPGPEMQRRLLSCLLVSPFPDRGLEFLKSSGFLADFWPELACLDEVDHSKEYHPEGNVWNHTLETFQHRKTAAGGVYDLTLSLGLLLHDMGKPISAAHGNRRFDGHAEIGAQGALRFLEHLGFEPPLIRDIHYLVKNHMLPAALKRLPITKTKEIMASPMFPTLMELYRCDESSSFKGLDGYYENSAAYQSYLRNSRNPYRSADGKKI